MKDEHAQFSGAIPAAYDRYLGSMLFQPYAEDPASRSLRHYAQRQAIIGVYTRMMVGTGAEKVDAETAVSERNLSRQPTRPKFLFVRAS